MSPKGSQAIEAYITPGARERSWGWGYKEKEGHYKKAEEVFGKQRLPYYEDRRCLLDKKVVSRDGNLPGTGPFPMQI